MARVLIDFDAELEARNGGGVTALMFAAMFRQTGLVDLLLERGADPSAKNVDGQTATDIARMQGYTSLAERLSWLRLSRILLADVAVTFPSSPRWEAAATAPRKGRR